MHPTRVGRIMVFVRPSVTDMINLSCLFHDAGYGPCNSLNMCMLALLITDFLILVILMSFL